MGTRPEIIRLSKVIPKLDAACEHILAHTGQSFDENMSGVFFKELAIREPDYNLGIAGGDFADQFGKLAVGIRDVIEKEKPDRLLVLGDTNSALAALIAKRMGVKVYHMEAGNRCYSDIVPEEVNRRVVDTCSDVLMPYTERARANLIREGYAGERIYVTGNPIWEVIKCIPDSDIDHPNEYVLATVHRQENVEDEQRLEAICDSFDAIVELVSMPIIFSCHPRTKERIGIKGGSYHEGKITVHEPFGLFDFITLERNATCVLTDSGTVQEECCLFHVPCVTLRDVTERPETVECGSNILAGVEPENVLRAVKVAMSKTCWTPPPEYLRENVSDTVVKIVAGF